MQYRFTKDFLDKKTGDVMNVKLDSATNNWLISTLLASRFLEEVKEEEWPKVEDEYWFITRAGDIRYVQFDNDRFDTKSRDFLGIYRTEEEAEKARDDVREFIRNRNKSND